MISDFETVEVVRRLTSHPRLKSRKFLFIPPIALAFMYLLVNLPAEFKFLVVYGFMFAFAIVILLVLYTFFAGRKEMDDFLFTTNLRTAAFAAPFFAFFGFLSVLGLVYYQTGTLDLVKKFDQTFFFNYIVLQLFVVAPIEELFFRWAWPVFVIATLGQADKPLRFIFIVLSTQGTFGLFHFSIMGGDILTISLLSGLGVLLFIVVWYRRAIGLFGAVGFHFGWNLGALIAASVAGVPTMVDVPWVM